MFNSTKRKRLAALNSTPAPAGQSQDAPTHRASEKKIPLNQQWWFSIITVLIALGGGLPGLYTLLNDKPKPNFKMLSLMTTNYSHPSDSTGSAWSKPAVMLFGYLSNSGKKPFFFTGVKATCVNKKTGNTYDLAGWTLPEESIESGANEEINITIDKPAEKDLFQIHDVKPLDAIPGIMLFTFPCTREELETNKNDLRVDITFLDLEENDYTSKVELSGGDGWGTTPATVLPAFGVHVRRKQAK